MAPLGPAPEIVSKLISFSAWVSLRMPSSCRATAISSRPPLPPSRSSQAKKRAITAPSRLWAARAPAISATFLRALGSRQGSAPRTIRPLPSLRKNQFAAVLGSSRTRLPAALSAASRGASWAGALSFAKGIKCARASRPILVLSMKSSGLPAAGTMAKASGTGLWATSEPRILKSQAIESGCVRITASALSRRRVSCSWASFSCAGLPA